MAETLRIFISHKMPTDTAMAEDIGSKLALYGGSQIAITHAGKFRYGDRWRDRIEEELRQADWLIFLATGQNEDWGFCLFECGYFSNTETSPKGNKKQLTTFCRKGDHVKGALEAFNALEISVTAVARLLKQIYVEPPYAIHPGLSEEKIFETAAEIVKCFEGGERVERIFDVAPSITIELADDDATQSLLRSGKLPDECPVTGTKDWQRLFGKAIDTGGWLWADLRNDWPFVEAYEYLIARMIADALEGKEPMGAIFRAPASEDKFRMVLRRFERMSGKTNRFHFTAGVVDLPFDLLQPGSTPEETVLYHLVNLTWYFRRRIVDKLYDRILSVKAMRNPPDAAVRQLYDELGRELMLVRAQAIMRNVDNSHVVLKALGAKDPKVKLLLNQSSNYEDLQKRIFDAMKDGADGLGRIAEDVYKMAIQNFEYYSIAAAKYADISGALPRPEPPDGA